MNLASHNKMAFEPDESGHFGDCYGGRFVAETLMPALSQLTQEYKKAQKDPQFEQDIHYYRRNYMGRPTPLWFAQRLTEHCGGARIFLKREDLNHTGSHKLNNVIGQILVARRMGKKRIIAETGAGQHGVATATVCALFGLKCEIYMGVQDVERQKPNVFRMKLLGAEVHPVKEGAGTLKDALNAAMRDWVAHLGDTYMLVGTVAGPHPYPEMVRDFQSVIGREVRQQTAQMDNRLPDMIVAAIGGGSNAMGIFYPFLQDQDVKLFGVEGAGHGLDSGKTAASIERGRPGVLHGNRTYLLQNDDGQIQEAHSISAGLDYPGVGPEHAWLHDIGRVSYVGATDDKALEAFHLCTRLEGIMPALESSHAIAFGMKLAEKSDPHLNLVINLSGRGDKDVGVVARHMGEAL